MQRIIALLIMLTSFSAAAQTSTIKGKVWDTASNKGLAYATISLVRAKDSTLVLFTKADSTGTFQIKKIEQGEYLVSTSYVGFLPAWKPVTVRSEAVDMGKIEMTDVKYTDEIVVKAKRPPVTMTGDTLEFNTENFKTQPNAVVEDMLKKMPGITIDSDGTVRVNGQRVNRVLVNGKEFFTGDPKLATKNLSADAVDKVQVFDKKSDQAAFTGVDDGNSEKAINLKLKKDKNNSLFGRLTGSAGDNWRYDAQGNINRFKGEQQSSFLGMGNNTNRQGFSMSDILNFTGEMARGMRGGGGISIRTGPPSDNNGLPVTGMGQNQQGVAKTYAGGLNYNDTWNKKTSVNASFIASDVDLNTARNIARQYLFPGNNYNYTQQSTSDRKVQQQRLNFSLDHQFDSLHSLKVTPQLSFQKSTSKTLSNYISETPSKAIINNGSSENVSKADGMNFASTFLFRKKFNKKGRTLAVNGDIQYNHSESKGWQQSAFTTYAGSTPDDSLVNQHNKADAVTRSYTTNVTYTEPLDKRSLVEMNVYNSRSVGESERNTYDFDNSSGKHDALNAALSNSFRSNYSYLGGGLHYKGNRTKFNFTAGASLQSAELKGLNKTSGTTVKQTFTDVLPDASLQWKLSQYRNFTLSYNTNTQQPSVRQLQPVADVSDPL
ncbi:MAG: outer rane beta-barrel protein, partial [Chitinophagaceae bacterium]|nr:outer rane beta-barrel protein [Chitinophagaceae bacterium]